MSAAELPDPAFAPDTSNLRRRAALASTAVVALAMPFAWGHGGAIVAGLVAIQALRLAFGAQALGGRWLVRLEAGRRARIEFAAHALLTIASLELADWFAPLWILAPIQVTVIGVGEAGGRWRVSALLAGLAALAALDGVPLATITVQIALSVCVYLIAEARTAMLGDALAAAQRKHDQLAGANRRMRELHVRMVAQERLSSLGMLASGIAHEINNPMSYVTANVRMLTEDMKGAPDLPASLREYADDILPATLDGIDRVNGIVADLRRFARSEAEEIVAYDLNKEVNAAIRIAQSQYKHRCRTEVKLGEVPTAMGMPRQIVQVVVNLMVNAYQAVSESGVVSVRTGALGDEVFVEVSDDGVGMTPETLRRLFEPFFTTKPVGQGTGLGLSVVHGIVVAHGGRIEVQSEPSKGTRFTVWFPRQPVEGSGSFRLPGPARAA